MAKEKKENWILYQPYQVKRECFPRHYISIITPCPSPTGIRLEFSSLMPTVQRSAIPFLPASGAQQVKGLDMDDWPQGWSFLGPTLIQNKELTELKASVPADKEAAEHVWRGLKQIKQFELYTPRGEPVQKWNGVIPFCQLVSLTLDVLVPVDVLCKVISDNPNLRSLDCYLYVKASFPLQIIKTHTSLEQLTLRHQMFCIHIKELFHCFPQLLSLTIHVKGLAAQQFGDSKPFQTPAPLIRLCVTQASQWMLATHYPNLTALTCLKNDVNLLPCLMACPNLLFLTLGSVESFQAVHRYAPASLTSLRIQDDCYAKDFSMLSQMIGESGNGNGTSIRLLDLGLPEYDNEDMPSTTSALGATAYTLCQSSCSLRELCLPVLDGEMADLCHVLARNTSLLCLTTNIGEGEQPFLTGSLLTEAMTSNTNCIWHMPALLPPTFMNKLNKRNKEIQQRRSTAAWNWGGLCVLLRFRAAVLNHPLQNSIVSLLPTVLEFTLEEEKEQPKKVDKQPWNKINLDLFDLVLE